MNPTQILIISEKYATILTGMGIIPNNRDTSLTIRPAEPDALAHCLWMCGEIEGMVKVGNRDKAVRWLCFIQGVLWTLGIQSVDSMRDDNRSIGGAST